MQRSRPNNFLEYLQSEYFYNAIFKRVFGFVCRHKDDVVLNGIKENVSKINFIEEDNMELDFKTVYIDSKDESRIEFDIAIEVIIEIQAYMLDSHSHESCVSTFWVQVSCKGSMDKDLEDFKILDVDIFSKEKKKKPLTGDLIPVIKREEYDAYAKEILVKYYPEAVFGASKIDVDKLASNMGLTLQDTTISKDASIFGQIFFDDSKAKVYDVNKGREETIEVKKNTILIDENATFFRSYGSRNMTIAHECVHAFLHRKAFRFARMINKELDSIKCQVYGVLKGTPIEWLEIQANGIAPCILMPEKSIRSFVDSQLTVYTDLEGLSSIVANVAEQFGVTIYASRKRLIDLGYENFVGVYNWIDGKYIRPYLFKKGSLKQNETYTIATADVVKLMTKPTVFPPIIEGFLQFVENHLVLNLPDYLEKDKYGNTILTEYARHHMDECCIKFSVKTSGVEEVNNEFGIMCYLCKDCGHNLNFDVEIAKNPESVLKNKQVQEQQLQFFKDVNAVVLELSGKRTFGESLNYLLEYLDKTILDLEVASGLNEKTIRRYINGEVKTPSKRTVVAMLRGLNLPAKITNVMLKQAGIAFVPQNEEDDLLLFILSSLRTSTPKDINDLLASRGYDPLTTNDIL